MRTLGILLLSAAGCFGQHGMTFGDVAYVGSLTEAAAGAPPASSLLTGLQAYWTLDESSDGSAPVVRYDSTANDNDLTDNNNCPSAAGALNNAVDCLVQGDYLSLADNNYLGITNSEAFTVTAWVYTAATNAHKYFVSKSGAADTDEYILYWHWTARQLALRSTDSSGTTRDLGCAFGAIQTNTWYFVAGWFDGSELAIQVNAGVTNTLAATSVTNSANPFEIGRAYQSVGYKAEGYIDEVGFWKRILTAAERTALYGGGSPPAYPFTGLP